MTNRRQRRHPANGKPPPQAAPALPAGQTLMQVPILTEPLQLGPDGNVKIGVGDEAVRAGIPAMLLWDGKAQGWRAVFLPAGTTWQITPAETKPALWIPGRPQ